jgi:hypothetical protein
MIAAPNTIVLTPITARNMIRRHVLGLLSVNTSLTTIKRLPHIRCRSTMGPNPTAGRDETHTTTVATRIITSPPGLPHGCRSHRHRMLISGPLRRVVIRTPGQTNLHTSESHSYTAARHQSSTLCLNIRSSTMDTPWSPVSGRTISREISLDVSSTSWHPTRRRQTPFERPATDSKSVPALSSLCSLLHQRGSKDRRCSHQNVHPACPISIEVVCTATPRFPCLRDMEKRNPTRGGRPKETRRAANGRTGWAKVTISRSMRRQDWIGVE